MDDVIKELEKILEQRKNKSSADSYVSSLYEKGNDYICDKNIGRNSRAYRGH